MATFDFSRLDMIPNPNPGPDSPEFIQRDPVTSPYDIAWLKRRELFANKSYEPGYAAAVDKMPYAPDDPNEVKYLTDWYNKGMTQPFTSFSLGQSEQNWTPDFGEDPYVSHRYWDGNVQTTVFRDGSTYRAEPYEGESGMNNFMSAYMPAATQAVIAAINPIAGAAASAIESVKQGGDLATGAAKALATYLVAEYGSDLLGGGSTTPTPSPTDVGYQLGGTSPVFSPGDFAVDPGLAPSADIFSVEPSLAPPGVSGTNYFDVNPALGSSPSEWSASLPPSDFQIGGMPTIEEPYTFGSNAQTFKTNPALEYNPAEAPFVFGGGERPFQVDTSLDPNATAIPTDWFTADNLIDAGKAVAKIFNNAGGGGGFGTSVVSEEALPGSASDLADVANAMNYGSGIGKSKGLNSAAFGSLYTALSQPNMSEIKDFGNATYYR